MTTPNQRRLVNPDLFLVPEDNPSGLRLRGTECLDCGEVFFGARIGCEFCQSTRLSVRPLADRGVLHSFTILRNPPPGAYGRAIDDFTFLAIGLIELPDRVRVLTPLSVPDDSPEIGAPFRLDFDEVSTPEGPATAYRFVLEDQDT
jgi:uncharacterized protein